jgi:WD40 repeat protein
LIELEGLPSIYSIAASSSKIVVSAGYSTGEMASRCGLYEMMLPSGGVHQIVSDSGCKYSSSWHSISLSPNGRRIVGVREHRLELIDTETKAVQSLGEGFYRAAWSPNGRWIAALGDSGDHTVLIDAMTHDKRKTLPPTAVIWSPDSHAILASRGHWYCGPDLATLHLVDIETGRSSTIQGSTCKISETVTAWINVPRQ